jgi:poly(A) polymerase
VPEPVIVPRADHRISRRDIDPDALRVLYRLHEAEHVAYLVGGSVRDLLLGRKPKDFDVGTDAHPSQVKRLFRNCWIIGRRFRLAHVKFGPKVIEVATFRKHVPPATAEDALPADETVVVATAGPEGAPAPPSRSEHGAIHRDNLFGTPEEDAFRRDFTINGLFYDIESKSVIDYVGGLRDLEHRIIRSIGDPRVRFVEDPVRMLRAVVFGARLGFDLDSLVIEAIAEHRALIATASPARLLEEYFKILRSGYSVSILRALGRARLLELITPELKNPPEEFWTSLSKLDAYRQRFSSAPAELTNTVLIGMMLVPLGMLSRSRPIERDGKPHHERVSFGILPVAKKDLERLRQLLTIVPRLADPHLPPRVARGMPGRPTFADAVTWLEILDDSPDAIDRWRQLRTERQAHQAQSHGRSHGHRGGHRPDGRPAPERVDMTLADHHTSGGMDPDDMPPAPMPNRRRKRRRRRRRGGGGGAPGAGPAAH